MRFFLDFKPGGGLCVILATMYRFKSEQRWRKFEFPTKQVSVQVENIEDHLTNVINFRPTRRRMQTSRCFSKSSRA